MKFYFRCAIGAWIYILIIAMAISLIGRIGNKNCELLVADYFFLGLTRLPCEVK